METAADRHAATAGPDDRERHWWARGAVAAWLAAIVVLVASEGAIGLTLLVVGHRRCRGGAGRWLSGSSPSAGCGGGSASRSSSPPSSAVLVIFLRQDVHHRRPSSRSDCCCSVAAAAHRATAPPGRRQWMPTVRTPRAARPVHRDEPALRRRQGGALRPAAQGARSCGAEVVLIEGPGHVDVAAIVRDAVGRGADLLGVAGGDGTQALVAGIAAEHDLPLLVISAGTRNHFALDLGLDRDDPSTCLARAHRRRGGAGRPRA